MNFQGAGWPRFKVLAGHRRKRDGAPVLLCVTVDGKREWIITVERWLAERRRGAIALGEVA